MTLLGVLALTVALVAWLNRTPLVKTLPATVTGRWMGKVPLQVRTKEHGHYIFHPSKDSIAIYISIEPDGIVSGTIGAARLFECKAAVNRGRIKRALHLQTDFIIRGKLLGQIFNADSIDEKIISIPFNVLHNQTEGSLFDRSGSWDLYPMANFQLHRPYKAVSTPCTFSGS